LIVQSDFNALTNLAQSLRTGTFYSGYQAEAVRYGVKTIAAYTDVSGAPPGAPFVGREDIKAYASSLGPRYLGALVIPHQNRFPQRREWLSLLSDLGRPVVWLDHRDVRTDLPSLPFLTRCRFSEEAATARAVSTLTALGHRVALYLLGGDESESWRGHRGEMLVKEGRRQGLEVRTVRHDLSLLNSPVANRLRSRHAAGPLGRSRWSPNEGFLPRVIAALKHRDATAWIAMRDRAAQHQIWWLRIAGLSVPDDISVISFDNRAASEATSVDFGFGYLGYAAFHLLFDMIPIRRDANGDVMCKPYVVDKGTVVAPRKRKLSLRKLL
jgi:DNA-binding LacI/PurR family transcriptional regulator